MCKVKINNVALNNHNRVKSKSKSRNRRKNIIIIKNIKK